MFFVCLFGPRMLHQFQKYNIAVHSVTLPSPQKQLPSVLIHDYYNIIDYVLYAVIFIPTSFSFLNWMPISMLDIFKHLYFCYCAQPFDWNSLGIYNGPECSGDAQSCTVFVQMLSVCCTVLGRTIHIYSYCRSLSIVHQFFSCAFGCSMWT